MCKMSASFMGVVSGFMLPGESVSEAKTRLIKKLEQKNVYLYETVKILDPRTVAQTILYARELDGDICKAADFFKLPIGLWYIIHVAYSLRSDDIIEWAEKIMKGKGHEYDVDPNPIRNSTCSLPAEIIQDRPCPGEDGAD